MLFISTMRTPASILVAALFSLLLAGCTSPSPPKPAMVPYGQTGDFGWREHELGESKFEVSYLGPWISLSPSEPNADPRLEAERGKVRDLAMWRAAELAEEQGAPCFKLEHEAIDNDIERRADP